jgi:predicted CXXCH cytochrome family protein
MSCARCHDPHVEDRAERLRALETPAGNAVCLDCHAALRGDTALRAHSHHAPDGAGGVCINCHMPRKNMGLGYELTRYHRIGSPTDPVRVQRDRPLECGLCHADRSVAALVTTMERWWGRRYDRDALVALYGADLGVNALAATLARGLPHEVATASGAVAQAGDRGALPLLATALGNEYPLVRYFALHAIERITGEHPPLDMNEPGPALVESARRWLGARAPAAPVAPAARPPSP